MFRTVDTTCSESVVARRFLFPPAPAPLLAAVPLFVLAPFALCPLAAAPLFELVPLLAVVDPLLAASLFGVVPLLAVVELFAPLPLGWPELPPPDGVVPLPVVELPPDLS